MMIGALPVFICGLVLSAVARFRLLEILISLILAEFLVCAIVIFYTGPGELFLAVSGVVSVLFVPPFLLGAGLGRLVRPRRPGV